MKCRIRPRDLQKVETGAQGARKLEGSWKVYRRWKAIGALVK
jgi:hypothetical protein